MEKIIPFFLIITLTVQKISETLITKREMHKGETNIEVLTPDTIDDFINSTTPSFVLFTGEYCQECGNFDYQLIILADNYKKANKNIRIGTICVRHYHGIHKRFDIYHIPTLRLFYRGMGLEYHSYGDNFKIIDQFAEGKLDFKEIFEIKHKKMAKFHKVMEHSNHALVYYGHEVSSLNERVQDILKCLFFRFSEEFRFFYTELKEVGDNLGLEEHNLYEYNRYDNKYRKVNITSLLYDSELDMEKMKEVGDWIEHNSYPKVGLWNIEWMRKNNKATFTFFYSSQPNTPEEAVFNSTCIEDLHKETRCLVFDREANTKAKLKSVYHLPFDKIPDPCVIEIKFYHDRREMFVKDAKGLNSQNFKQFVDDVNNERIPEFHALDEQEPEDNKERLIKVVTSSTLDYFLKNNEMDSFIVFYDS